MGLLSTTHIHKHTKEYVPYAKNVTIHEHRASTDDSLKLLNEMQDKAIQNILSSVIVDCNHLKCVVLFFHDSIINDQISFHAKFTLNGQEYRIAKTFSKREFMIEIKESIDPKNMLVRNSGENLLRHIHKVLSEAIAEELMKSSGEFMDKMFSTFRI